MLREWETLDFVCETLHMELLVVLVAAAHVLHGSTVQRREVRRLGAAILATFPPGVGWKTPISIPERRESILHETELNTKGREPC